MQNKIKNWTAANIPQKKDGLAMITGSTEGFGYEDALALSSVGWNIIMMGRTSQKGAQAIAKIFQINPKVKVSFEKIDLADLSSIKSCASKMIEKGEAINLLINKIGSKLPMRLSYSSAQTI
ncbi:SDR family NAD(P)-dependent oxidoreductase [Chryseobacterium viscerum]|uniref:SDR family NAD(P)-dependent oxidoreductase n=1 Tax=Chryseobacterium viscerum TaxID=1037377 RepID=UPI001E459323|nr:SDR family NAD(P)-dependent oxidoreductase [Chryseobacterium viscerum]